MAVVTPRNLHIVFMHLVIVDEYNISRNKNNSMPVRRINRVTDLISEEKRRQSVNQKILRLSLTIMFAFKRFMIVDDSGQNHALTRICNQVKHIS